MIELHILLIFMIIGAIIAIEVKDLLSSVIAVSAVGLALSITFLILKAPDVAITQLVVEILILIILIQATLKRDLPFSTTGRWFLNTLIALAFIATFLSISYIPLSRKSLRDNFQAIFSGWNFSLKFHTINYIPKRIQPQGKS